MQYILIYLVKELKKKLKSGAQQKFAIHLEPLYFFTIIMSSYTNSLKTTKVFYSIGVEY